MGQLSYLTKGKWQPQRRTVP